MIGQYFDALGARTQTLLAMVMREGLTLSTIGLRGMAGGVDVVACDAVAAVQSTSARSARVCGAAALMVIVAAAASGIPRGELLACNHRGAARRLSFSWPGTDPTTDAPDEQGSAARHHQHRPWLRDRRFSCIS